jgi:hypothetical protein
MVVRSHLSHLSKVMPSIARGVARALFDLAAEVSGRAADAVYIHWNALPRMAGVPAPIIASTQSPKWASFTASQTDIVKRVRDLRYSSK